MEEDRDRNWFGEDMIQRNGDRITLPPAVAEAGIAEPGETVYWGEDESGVLLSKRRGRFEDADRFRLLGETTVADDREVTIPDGITTREGFDAGDILHFVASDALADDACRVMTEDASERPRS